MRAAPALAQLGVEAAPFVMSVNGRLHPSAKRFMKHLAEVWGRAQGLALDVAKLRLKEQLSLELHRANGELLVAEGRRWKAFPVSMMPPSVQGPSASAAPPSVPMETTS